eukprot:1143298-Pelagomonas_calceolata.AAC.4
MAVSISYLNERCALHDEASHREGGPIQHPAPLASELPYLPRSVRALELSALPSNLHASYLFFAASNADCRDWVRQFLPQDMVVEFARMNSYELLVATMKAMGDSQLERDHTALMQMRQQIKDAESLGLYSGKPV